VSVGTQQVNTTCSRWRPGCCLLEGTCRQFQLSLEYGHSLRRRLDGRFPMTVMGYIYVRAGAALGMDYTLVDIPDLQQDDSI
jgi:hypothetical protein